MSEAAAEAKNKGDGTTTNDQSASSGGDSANPGNRKNLAFRVSTEEESALKLADSPKDFLQSPKDLLPRLEQGPTPRKELRPRSVSAMDSSSVLGRRSSPSPIPMVRQLLQEVADSKEEHSIDSRPRGSSIDTKDEKEDLLVGLRKKAAEKYTEENHEHHHVSASMSEMDISKLRNLQLTALKLARKTRESTARSGTKATENKAHGVYAILAAKRFAKKMHEKSRTLNASKWRGLIQKSKKEKIPLQTLPEIVELMKAGIPPSIRGEVWKEFLAIDKQKAKHPENYYKTLKSNADYVIKKFCTGSSSSSSRTQTSTPEWLSQIQKDIPRTLHDVQSLESKDARESLLRILVCYYYRNPQAVGYCQGMNLVAAGLLSVMDEADAFWSLVCVIESRIGYYTKSMAGLLVDQCVLESLFSYYLPDLYDHMKKLEVTIASFTTSWFICLFMETPVPYKVCMGLWDYLFCYGDEMLFQVSLALLKKKRKEILELNDSGMLLMFMLKLGADLERWILSEVSAKLGELITSISTLRRSNQIKVRDDHSTLKNMNHVEKLRKRYRIETDDEVQELWKTFISPAPWSILVQNCIPSMVWFSSALVKACYQEESKNWRASGLLSGFALQLFNLLDVHGTGQISFDNFVWLTRILNHGSARERAKLAFRFFDYDGDRRVGKADLLMGIKRIGRMYDGRASDQRRRMFMLVNSFLFWYSTSSSSSASEVAKEKTVVVELPRKPFGFSIGEINIGRAKLLEVSAVDGEEAQKAGIEPGWKICKINGRITDNIEVPELVKLCREATLPCEISFQTPPDHRLRADDFIKKIDALIRLEPRLMNLFFGNYHKRRTSGGAKASSPNQGKLGAASERLARWFKGKQSEKTSGK